MACLLYLVWVFHVHVPKEQAENPEQSEALF